MFPFGPYQDLGKCQLSTASRNFEEKKKHEIIITTTKKLGTLWRREKNKGEQNLKIK